MKAMRCSGEGATQFVGRSGLTSKYSYLLACFLEHVC